jgi:hypothetical protein
VLLIVCSVLEIISFQLLKEPFDDNIRKFLKHNVTQPILKLGPNADPSPEECLEVRKCLKYLCNYVLSIVSRFLCGILKCICPSLFSTY